jgi:hypothetical protein
MESPLGDGLVLRGARHDDGKGAADLLALLDEVIHIDGLSVPAVQIELVATDPEYAVPMAPWRPSPRVRAASRR